MLTLTQCRVTGKRDSQIRSISHQLRSRSCKGELPLLQTAPY